MQVSLLYLPSTNPEKLLCYLAVRMRMDAGKQSDTVQPAVPQYRKQTLHKVQTAVLMAVRRAAPNLNATLRKF